MPAYDYRCLACDTVFEQRVAVDRADDVRCPAGHDEVRRLISAFAVGRGASAPAASPSGGGCCGGACGCG